MYILCFVTMILGVVFAIAALGCIFAKLVLTHKGIINETVIKLPVIAFVCACIASIFLATGAMETSCDHCEWEYQIVAAPEYCENCGEPLHGEEE